MPLSEDERRILSEIEQRLYESDPHLAHEVSSTTVYSRSIRGMKWTALGFVAGIVMLLGTLSTSYVLAFIGFLVMLASALVFERNARHLGRTGIQQISRRHGEERDEFGGFGGFGSLSERMRDRFRRDPDPDED